jgi:hypothetical protein
MGKATTEGGAGSVTYYTIAGGDIVNRVDEGTEGAVPHTITKGPNEGKVVWDMHNNSIPGVITGGGIVVKEILGKKVPEIHMNLDDDAMLQIPMYLLKNIAEVLPNVDRTQEIKIRSYKSNKGNIGLEISQGGTKLESHFTVWEEVEGSDKKKPKNINGLPKPTFDDIDGWDFRDHDKFLKGVVIEFFEQYAGQAAPEAQAPAPEADGVDETPVPF